jgi:pimeloyl-ACP methyl ester carboxylesterase
VTVARSGGVDINFEVVGPTSGELVVLVNGLGQQIGDVEFPDEHVDQFVAAGFRVARIDNRDSGLSTTFDSHGRPPLEPLIEAAFAGKPVPVPYTFIDMGDDLIAVVDAIGAQRVHLVGASMGGFVVRWAALRHPQRVASLTIVMSGSGADPEDPAPQLDLSSVDELFTIAEARERDAHIAFTVETWRQDWGTAFPFDEAWITERVAKSFDRSYQPDGTYRQILAGAGSSGLWQSQHSITAPTLVVHGSEDQIFPIEHAEATTARIDAAQLWRMDSVGHSMPPQLWPEMIKRIAHLGNG